MKPAMKLYGPIFAVMLADLIGYREPLIDRLLRDPAEVKLKPVERKFLASRLADSFKWPTSIQVSESRDKLRRAAHYLEYLYGNDGRVTAENAELLGKKSGSKMTAADAEQLASRKCRRSTRTIQRAVEYAQALPPSLFVPADLGDGKWWTSAIHLAKKGPRKHESLHRTY
jgi:hypothetical protein